MPSGYEAVKRIAREEDASWLSIVRDCHDVLVSQGVAGGVQYFDTKWLRARTGRQRYPSLAPLVRWGVLTDKLWRTVDGRLLPKSGRNFYEMPDRPGVGRALDELAVPPATIR